MDDSLFARLLFDVMVPPRLAEALRVLGYDVTEARALPVEVQRDDGALLEEAARQRRALVTANYSDPRSNLCLIHQERQAAGREHAGIILVPHSQLSDRVRRWEVRDRLALLLNQYTWDELHNEIRWLP